MPWNCVALNVELFRLFQVMVVAPTSVVLQIPPSLPKYIIFVSDGAKANACVSTWRPPVVPDVEKLASAIR